ncbi:hypothetical protein ACIBCA_20500 [Kitasatospora sp. NPDC051170]|uniref:hypothetical protein n=1 Tax=Kitasatospora sp. NPDC051170 TaxID=3364056 RepID=UPI00378878C0
MTEIPVSLSLRRTELAGATAPTTISLTALTDAHWASAAGVDRSRDRTRAPAAKVPAPTALEAWNYWNAEGIPTPFNGTIPKGEIGINTAYPRAAYAVWIAETCERGLLHPVERLDVTFVPRLADLSMTAMRRDQAGKAAGHLRHAPSH